MTVAVRVTLLKAEPLLVERVQQLQDRVRARDESAWPEFLQILHLLVDLQSAVAPERVGAMLTTEEMAARFGVSPKTLLKRKNRGEIEPSLQQGHLIRWSGREHLLPGVGRISCRKRAGPDGTGRSTTAMPPRRNARGGYQELEATERSTTQKPDHER